MSVCTSVCASFGCLVPVNMSVSVVYLLKTEVSITFWWISTCMWISSKFFWHESLFWLRPPNAATTPLILNNHHPFSQRHLITDIIICLWDYSRTKVMLMLWETPPSLQWSPFLLTGVGLGPGLKVQGVFGSAASVSFVDNLGRLSIQPGVYYSRQHLGYM